MSEFVVEKRKNENLPCGHQFSFYELTPDNKTVIKCCTCGWQMIKEDSPRNTDMTRCEFEEIKREWR